MSFLDLLHIVGGRLRIVETATENVAGEPAKVVTRTITLTELKTEIRSEEVRSLADAPAELTVPFEKIFEAAGVAGPACGWNLARLKAMLQAEPYKNQEHAAVQKSLLASMSAEHVEAEDLVKEAMAQDRALDEFEIFARKKVEDHMAAAEHQIADLEAKIQALQGERARLAARIQLDQDRFREWRRKKRAYEHDLAAAVGYLTDRSVITTDDLAE
jgi:hypothetical protein